MLKKLFVLFAIVTLLAGCQTTEDSVIKKEHIGALAGAIGGAAVGSNLGKGKGNIAAIAAGTLLGAYVGKELGASLDRADLAYYDKTTQYSLEKAKTNTTSSWENPDSGNSGTITPTRTYQTDSGYYCREFKQTIVIDGKKETAYGTACRQSDGSWQLANN